MVIDNQMKEAIKSVFEDIHNNQLQAKTFNSTNKDLTNSLSETLKVPKGVVREAYKYWLKTSEGEEDPLQAIAEILEAAQS